MIILAYILSGLSLLMSVLLLIRLKVSLLGLILWFPKLAAEHRFYMIHLDFIG